MQRSLAAGALLLAAVLLLTLVPADHAVTARRAVAAVAAPAAAGPEPLPPAPVAPPPAPVPPPVAALPPAPPPAPPMAKARPTMGAIVTNAVPKGSRFSIDGHVRRPGAFAVVPGTHVLSVAVAGYQPNADTVRVRPGDTLRWTPRLVAIASAPPARAVAPPAPAPRSAPRDDAVCDRAVAAEQWDAAFDACSRAATAGSAVARRDLASLYQHGHGVHRSDEVAAQWYQLAAQANDAESMYQLGDAYEHGHGVAKNAASAIDWYTRAANHGSAAAEYVLAQCYEKGHLGLDKDRARALDWYRKAAAQHYKDADSKVQELSR